MFLRYFFANTDYQSYSAVKLAKQVLKLPENRQNLSLWDGYARIERQRGKIEDARTVYVTALSMYREFKKEDQVDGPLLWRAWAEMEWEEGRSMLALKILVAASVDQELDLCKYWVGNTMLDADLTFFEATLAKVDPDVRPAPAQILRSRQVSFLVNMGDSFNPLPFCCSITRLNWKLPFNPILCKQSCVTEITLPPPPPSLSISRSPFHQPSKSLSATSSGLIVRELSVQQRMRKRTCCMLSCCGDTPRRVLGTSRGN